MADEFAAHHDGLEDELSAALADSAPLTDTPTPPPPPEEDIPLPNRPELTAAEEAIIARHRTPVSELLAAMAAPTPAPAPMPTEIVDCHHHFLEPGKNDFQAFLRKLGCPSYPCEKYALDRGDLPIARTVHVEALPDDGVAEAAWVTALIDGGRAPYVAAIVAKCDLSADDCAETLDRLAAVAPKLRGIRYILDYDGPFGEGNATHVECSRHGLDYLRDRDGPAAAFERGFALLAARNLSFDLQCCPLQLPAAAKLCARHPGVRVVLDHLGKPYKLKAREEDLVDVAAWRRGIRTIAAVPSVYVKLSMLGYAVPGWSEDAIKTDLVKELVLETIQTFGAKRCMFASNWHVDGPTSNSDGGDRCAMTMPQLYAIFNEWVEAWGFDAEAKHALFAGTAAEFYRLDA